MPHPCPAPTQINCQVGKNYELLNCDDHANFLRRHNKDPALYRPDICHQVLIYLSGDMRYMFGGVFLSSRGVASRVRGVGALMRSHGVWRRHTAPLPTGAAAILDSPLNSAGAASGAELPASIPTPCLPPARRCWPSWTAR